MKNFHSFVLRGLPLLAVVAAACYRLGLQPITEEDASTRSDGETTIDADDATDGDSSTAPDADVDVVDAEPDHDGSLLSLVVEPVYPSFANWNDYIEVSDGTADAYHQPEITCEGTEAGYMACLHAGEKRRVVVAERPDCESLDIEDALDAFDWECQVESGHAVFFTRGLRDDKGLADLVTATGFRENAVTVREGTEVVGTSAPAVWGWANHVRSLPENPTLEVLSEAGTIYVASSTPTHHSAGYNIDADRVALVALPGTRLVSTIEGGTCNLSTGEADTTATPCLVASGGQRFVWVEGELYRDPSYRMEMGLFLVDQTFATVRHVHVSGSEYRPCINFTRVANSSALDMTAIDGRNDGIFLQDTTASLFRVVRASNNARGGILLAGSSDNRFYDVQVANSPDLGLQLDGSLRNVLVGVIVSNCGEPREDWLEGLRLIRASTDNTLVGVLAHNNMNNGVAVGPSTTRNTILNVTTANNSRRGFSAYGATFSVLAQALLVSNGSGGISVWDGTDLTFVNIAVLNNSDGSGVYLGNVAARLHFRGHLMVGSNGTDCVVDGTVDDPGLIRGTCTDTGLEGSSTYGSYASDAVLHVGRDLTGGMAAMVVADDRSNLSDVDGARPYDEITDWLDFENSVRGWGIGGSPFPDASNRMRCVTTDDCRIWDFRPLRTDTVVRGFNGSFTAGETCPSSAQGDVTCTDFQVLPNIFLVNATEIVLDGIGDDDGLCESNEACIFSPNLGAYQGEGDLVGPCLFEDGLVHDVTLMAHSLNGA